MCRHQALLYFLCDNMNTQGMLLQFRCIHSHVISLNLQNDEECTHCSDILLDFLATCNLTEEFPKRSNNGKANPRKRAKMEERRRAEQKRSRCTFVFLPLLPPLRIILPLLIRNSGKLSWKGRSTNEPTTQRPHKQAIRTTFIVKSVSQFGLSVGRITSHNSGTS